MLKKAQCREFGIKFFSSIICGIQIWTSCATLEVYKLNQHTPYRRRFQFHDWNKINSMHPQQHWNGLYGTKNSPVILFMGSNVSILSTRSIASGWTCGKTWANDWRGCWGSCRIYLFASSLRTNPRSASVGVPRS